MGADLCLVHVDITEPINTWLDRLGEWDDGTVDHFADKYGVDYILDDIREALEYDGFTGSALEALLRQRFVERVQQAIECAYSEIPSRTVNKARLGDRWWAITGGLTWGDVPTDEYDDFLLADAAIEFMGSEKT